MYQPVTHRTRPKGRRAQWGDRSAAPHHHVYGAPSWRTGRAWGYGRIRACRSTHLRCRWSVRGPQLPVQVFVVEVPGDRAPWFLVTTALDRAAAQVVAACAARGRPEDGFRDHQPRLGREQCRAWTKEPVRRTCQGQRVALTLLRRLQCRLDQTRGGGSWWSNPEWYAQNRHASIRDLCRRCWRHRTVLSPRLVALEETETPCHGPALQGNGVSRAA